jgi:hypothetical protein
VLRIFRGYEIAIWMAAAVRRGRAGFVRGTFPRRLHSRPYLKRLFSTGPFPRVFLPFVNTLVKILPSCRVNVVRDSGPFAHGRYAHVVDARGSRALSRLFLFAYLWDGLYLPHRIEQIFNYSARDAIEAAN